MPSILPPSPQGVPPGHAFWNVWYEKLRTIINNIATSIQWVNLNFTGSKIEDIVSRDHNKLTSIQGGTTAEYYHLTNAQYITVTGLANPDITGTAKDMNIKPAAPGGAENAGALNLSARSASGAIYNGGNVSVTGGNGGASATGGDVLMNGGAGDLGGGVSQTGGSGASFGGNVSIIGGGSTGASGFAGNVAITGGTASGSTSTGGSVSIAPGSGTSSGGSVTVKGPNGLYGIEVSDDGFGALIGLFGVTPIAQPTTAGAAAVFVANAGVAVNDTSTFDGYTIGQVVKALRSLGLLA